MDYCPVLLRIVNKILKKEYDCEYLLQVWNQDGKMVYERHLKNQVNVWGISNEIFIYKPSKEDTDSDYFHVLDLKNGNSTLLVKDPINDPTCNHLSFYEQNLYIANSSDVYILQCDVALQAAETRKVELTQHQIHKITPGVPIHAMFNVKNVLNKFYWRTPVVLALETQDNQIDFSQIIPENVGKKNFTYILRQQKDIVHRNVKMDPIIKFVHIIDKQNVFFGIALRKSGQFDIYWNMTPVDSPQNVIAQDISCSFDCLYFHLKNNSIKGIKTKAGPSVNFEQSALEDDEFEFPIIYYQKIKNHVNIYNSFTLVGTTLYLVHGRFVSLYNIQENTWLKHCKFAEAPVRRLFEKECKGGAHEIGILLENGAIYNNMANVFFSENGEETVQNKLMTIDLKNRTFKLEGQIIKTSQDQSKNEWFTIMVKDEEFYTERINEEQKVTTKERFRLFSLHYDSLYEMRQGLVKELDAFTNIVHVHAAQHHENCYIVLQKGGEVQCYEINLVKPMELDDEDSALMQNEDIVDLVLILNHNVGIEGNIHSCVSSDIKDHMFFVDHDHFYKFQFKNKISKTYRDQACVGLYLVDEKYCYTLSHSSDERSSGLRLYDLNNILKKDTDVSYKLSNVQVGCSAFLDWNSDYFRLSLLKSLDTLIIVPALHRNTIAFIGMGKRETYLATKVIKDKFIALDNKNYIFTWSTVTGKLLSYHKLPARQDLQNFSIFCSPMDSTEKCPYQREWYQKILLVKNEPEQNFDEAMFYKEEGMPHAMKNQLLFGQAQRREFREFRLIEIISESEVKEHFSFIHPYYQNERQRIYFDTKNKYMLEKLSHPRVFLYEKEDSKFQKRQMKWHLIKRMNKFPEQLENDSGFLRTMSPSFLHYIDIDRKLNMFVIRDTLSLKEIYTIPSHLMDLSQESPKEIMNRFIWVDDDAIKIINKEGIEKLIDMKSGMDEVEYNAIPLFNQKEIKDPLYSYYTNRQPLDVSQVKMRLIRKYQKYKSAYYLHHKQDPQTLYDEIFNVDYQINGCQDMHVADLSFTYLHWKIMEQLETKNLTIDLIDNQQVELLFYNIIPGGDTIMHKLTQTGDTIKKIMEIAHPDEENVCKIAIHIPFLQNLQHKSPMHICMEQQDIRTMDTFLTFLAGYGLDHHSRAVVEVIPFCIEKQLPSLLSYIDSRMQQTEKLQKINKGCLKDPNRTIMEMSLWFGQQEYEQKLMKQRIDGDDTLIDRPIRVEFVDIPKVYHYDDELCDNFFGALADTDQLEIFQRKAIQKLIEFNYNLVKVWTIKKLQIPFMCFQVNLFIYLNFIFGQDSSIAGILNFPMQILLGCFACYFLRNEMIQMKDDGWAYLSSVWNYIDIITPSTVLTVLFINTFQIEIGEETERIIQAIGVFFMWFKFLYFFRIFKSFGYLIRLMILVIADMKDFLVVLFFTLVAFGDTFLTISNGNKPGMETEPFVFGFTDAIIYTYLIILGSFEMSHFQNSIASSLLITFFIMCTVFNTIVMLNLLIAIISETFSNFKENYTSASFQEMSAMIAENSYLIPDNIKHRYAKKNKYLMVVTDLEAEMEANSDEIMQRLDLIKKNVLSKIDKMGKMVKKIKKQKKKQQLWLEKQSVYNTAIMNLLQQVPGIQLKQVANELESHKFASGRPPSRQQMIKPQGGGSQSSEGDNQASFKILAEQLNKLRQMKKK